MNNEIKQRRRLSSYGLITSEGKLLLSQLNCGPCKGKWSLPGGGIDHGENPEVAFRRELKEEADIDYHGDLKLVSIISENIKWKTPENINEDLHLIGILYRINLPKIVQVKEICDGSSSDGCKWFDINNLNFDIVAPTVIKAIKENLCQ